MSDTRRRLAAASFGPEWEPFGDMAYWLIHTSKPRDRERMRAHLRDARRDLVAREAIYDRAVSRAGGAR